VTQTGHAYRGAEPDGEMTPVCHDRQERYLRILRAIEDCVGPVPDLDRLGHDVLSKMVRLLSVDGAALYATDRSTGLLRLVARFGLSSESVAALATPNLLALATATVSTKPLLMEAAPGGIPPGAGLSSMPLIPLRLGDHLAGVLLIGCREERAWDDGELPLLEAVGVRLYGEIERANLHGCSERSQARLRAMRTVALSVGEMDLDEALRQALATVLGLCDLDAGTLLMVQQDGLGHVRVAQGPGSDLLFSVPPVAVTEGLIGQAISSGKTQISEDVASDARVAFGAIRAGQFQTLVCTPLLGKSGVFGTMNLASGESLQFDADTLDFLQAIGNQIGIVIENVCLHEENRQRLARFTAIQETTAELVTRLDLADVLLAIVERATKLLRAKGGALHLYHPETEELESVVSCGLLEACSGEVFPGGEGPLGRVTATGEPLVMAGHDLHPLGSEGHMKGDFSAVAAIPLIWGDSILGVLDLVDDAKGRTFGDDDVAMLGLFAAHAAIALENARMSSDISSQLSESRALLKFAQAMTTTWSLPDVLDLVVQVAAEVIPAAKAAGVHLLDSEGEELILRALSCRPGIGTIGEGSGSMKVSEGIAGLAVTEGRLINCPDVRKDPRFMSFPETRSFRSLLVAPLVLGSERVGTLSVDSSEARAFGSNDEHLLTLLCAQASVAIGTVRLYEETLRRSEEAREAYQSLREMAGVKDEFVARVTHELKAPLAPMRVAVERTLTGAFGPLNETQQEMLRIALTNVDKLAEAIKELLDVVRLSAQGEESDWATFDLRSVAKDSITAMRPAAEAKEVALVAEYPDVPVLVHADQRKIGRVFSNLLSNAIRFNRPSGEVRLRVTWKDEQWAQVSVADTGIGIPEQAMDRIFTRFFQVENVSTRAHEGLGLGLAIVKEYVELSGGSVWAESQEGKGSVFTFTLPLA